MIKLTTLFKVLLTGLLVMILSGKLSAQNDSSEISWISLEKALETQKEGHKKIMLFMEADWCTLCKKMKKEVFPEPEVWSLINNKFYSVRIDIESEETVMYGGKKWTKKELSQEFGLYATPTFIFMDTDQSVIGNKPGYMDKQDFKDLLNFVANEEYKKEGFKDLKR
jgi:thioredoxin-related protein